MPRPASRQGVPSLDARPAPCAIQNVKPSLQSVLARLSAERADATRIAYAAAAMLLAINAALAPVLSERGVSALYRRSLYLIRSDFPWLVPVYEGALTPGQFGMLRLVIARQTDAEARRATAALLRTLQELLVSLIGLSLTERLLQPVWDTPSSGDAAQDTSR